ncbi:MAG: UDP-N-acetylmuramate dehydrogenase [Micromonosporaceae bacterium]
MIDVTLAEHTTLRLGGPAKRLVTIVDPDEVRQLVREPGPLLILAGGSNVVVGDDGFPGTVALLRTNGIRTATDGDDVLLTVESGQPWDDVVALAVTEGLAGIECLSGIPGSAGATPMQNVGAYGQEVAQTIVTVRALDRHTGQTRDLPAAECGFAYRTSRFRQAERFVVLAVTFRLRRSSWSEHIRYAELAAALAVPVGGRAPLAQVRTAVLALRAGKGMVLDPLDPDTFSVGSFFTNPVLAPDAFPRLRQRALDRVGAEPVAWAGADGATKVSAAWLIERAGFGRGYHGGHPGVAVSAKHTLALTNRGTGSTAALLALAREIRDGVAAAFDVQLTPEPVLVNCAL